VIVGGLLSFAAVGLKPAQEKQIELDTKGQILGAVMDLQPGDDVLAIYADRITSEVVDINGNPVETNRKGESLLAEKVDIAKEYKLPPEERFYPVYKYMSKENPEEVEAYIFPVYGNGLWDKIWGYIALDANFKTIKGVSFDHKAETPGLGARIASDEVQQRFVGKEIYDDQGNLISVEMVKGEGHGSLDAHHVDGLAGATMTAKGVNNMLRSYLESYQSYIQKVKEGDKNLTILHN
jgi:Na+-transporting NADH:ubiquinone oxidoreductase subunit C